MGGADEQISSFVPGRSYEIKDVGFSILSYYKAITSIQMIGQSFLNVVQSHDPFITLFFLGWPFSAFCGAAFLFNSASPYFQVTYAQRAATGRHN